VTKTVTTPATNVGTLPSEPRKTEYTFSGWYTAVNGGGTQFTATTPVTDDITVYAKWIAGTIVDNDCDGVNDAWETQH